MAHFLVSPNDKLRAKMEAYNSLIGESDEKIAPSLMQEMLVTADNEENAKEEFIILTPLKFVETPDAEKEATNNLIIEKIDGFDPKIFEEVAQLVANELLTMKFKEAAETVDNATTRGDFEQIWQPYADAMKDLFVETIYEKYRETKIGNI